MIRVSVTQLESFRRVIQTQYGDEAELIASIEGQPFTPSWQMRAGSAWHALLAGGEQGEADEFRFSAEDVAGAKNSCTGGLCELKATRTAIVDRVPVVVSAMADRLTGATVTEHKATFSAPDTRSYEASLQWRYYLWVFGASCVEYRLWHFSESDKAGQPMRLLGHVSFRCWPYERLEADCLEWLTEFYHWVQAKGLAKHLEKRAQEAS